VGPLASADESLKSARFYSTGSQSTRIARCPYWKIQREWQPAIEIAYNQPYKARRGSFALFGSISKITEPLPNPRFKDLILIHSGWFTTSQKQPAGAVTASVDCPPLATASV